MQLVHLLPLKLTARMMEMPFVNIHNKIQGTENFQHKE